MVIKNGIIITITLHNDIITGTIVTTSILEFDRNKIIKQAPPYFCNFVLTVTTVKR